jgi:hypothetical protein
MNNSVLYKVGTNEFGECRAAKLEDRVELFVCNREIME